MIEQIWVICRDNGYEGLSEPFMAFIKKESAEQAMKLLEDGYTTARLCEVQVWKADQ